jgi:hypothetical protein
VIGRAQVMPFLFHVSPEEVDGPLAQFQSTVYHRDDVHAMVRSLNSHLERPLSPELLDRTFDKWWEDLDVQLRDISLLSGNETRTFYRWLYTRSDLDVNSLEAEFRSAWIISNEAERYLDQTMKAKIRAACELGKTFKYFLPRYKDYDQSDLRTLVEDFPNNVHFKLFPKDEFESQAPSDYIILNPDGEGELRVLVKLPLGEHGQQEYWFKTNDRSARSFVSRFRRLWDGHLSAVAA